MNNPSLDEDLKLTVKDATDKLEATQCGFQSTLEAMAKEIEHLRADKDRSKEAEKILQKTDGMENNRMATQLD